MSTTAKTILPAASAEQRHFSRILLVALVALAVVTLAVVAWQLRGTSTTIAPVEESTTVPAPYQPGGSAYDQQVPGGAADDPMAPYGPDGSVYDQQVP